MDLHAITNSPSISQTQSQRYREIIELAATIFGPEDPWTRRVVSLADHLLVRPAVKETTEGYLSIEVPGARLDDDYDYKHITDDGEPGVYPETDRRVEVDTVCEVSEDTFRGDHRDFDGCESPDSISSSRVSLDDFADSDFGNLSNFTERSKILQEEETSQIMLSMSGRLKSAKQKKDQDDEEQEQIQDESDSSTSFILGVVDQEGRYICEGCSWTSAHRKGQLTTRHVPGDTKDERLLCDDCSVAVSAMRILVGEADLGDWIRLGGDAVRGPIADTKNVVPRSRRHLAERWTALKGSSRREISRTASDMIDGVRQWVDRGIFASSTESRPGNQVNTVNCEGDDWSDYRSDDEGM